MNNWRLTKIALAVLYALAGIQLVYNLMTFNPIIHGEAAWRMLTCRNSSCDGR